MLKKVLISIGTVALALLLAASTNVLSAATAAAPADRQTIALVNEDEPATFNGATYLFGKEFVSLVSNADQNNWQVVSRSVAERAFADETVSAVVVLPRTFSHDLLTLQDLNPVKATIDYRVIGDDELSRERLESRMFTIIRDFNSRIVQMYFASVASNISGAQVNMESVVSSQTALLDSVSNTLRPDLEKTAKSYDGSIDMATVLRALNSAWVSAQNGFTTNTTDTLTSVSDSLGRQQPSLSEYFSQQEQIAKTNVANGNTALTDQGASDKNYYDQAFSEHIDGLFSGGDGWSGLDGFSSTDASGNNTGMLASLRAKVQEYDGIANSANERVEVVKQSLTRQQGELITSRDDLMSLEARLLSEYFGVTMPITDSNYNVSLETLTPEMARSALAQKLSNTFSASGSAAASVKSYEDKIRDLVGRIPTDPAQYTELFSALKAAHSAFEPQSYIDQLDLIQHFAKESPGGAPAPQLNVVSTPPEPAEQSATKTLPVTVPAGSRYVVSVDLPESLEASRMTVGLGAGAPACAEATPNCVTVDQANDSATLDNSEGTAPMTVSLTYTIDLEDIAGTATLSYTAQDTTVAEPVPPTSLGTDVYILVPHDAVKSRIAGDDFVTITEYLGNIRTAANLIQFLYGAPDDTLETFTSAVGATGDIAGHSEESVANRYGTIDAVDIEKYLSAADVDSYRTLGHDNIAAIVTQIDAVRRQLASASDNVATLNGLSVPEGYFSGSVQALEQWFAAAVTSVNASPALWEAKSNTVIQLKTTAWNDQDPGLSELYLDEKTGPALHATLSQLVATTSANAKSVAASARIITDNSADFDELVSSVQKTQTETQAVLDAMSGTISTGSSALATSSDYSERFSTVLANTRANGADPAKIYDSFANPITTTNSTPKAAATAPAFDYTWIPVFLAGSLIGGLLTVLNSWRRKRTRG
ncbi:type VII secretion protein EsaA [Leifsonia sp. NPDC014704]|uniref:type VII secretion protein EsaA n=1 Tax=Leifsonia sp. NPDC014704 TaxID=3364123 RepID=UPI0036F4A355